LIKILTKISLLFILAIYISSCNAVKRVPDDKFLLTENTITVDGEEIKDAGVYSQLYQRPNPKIPVLGIPFGLHIYNFADPQPDSTYIKWLNKKPKRKERLESFISKKQVDEIGNSYIGFNKWLEKSGDAPVIVSEEKTNKSLERVKAWYAKRGWFNTKGDYKVIPDSNKNKRASVEYDITRYKPYFIDSISKEISSPAVDSIFKATKKNTFIKTGKQYAATDFENERARLNIQFRNSGLYYFDQSYIRFEADTVDTGHKANIKYLIPDRKITIGDTTFTEPFRVHKINQVRVVTDYSFNNRNKKWGDSAVYNGYQLFSYDELDYRPKAITDALSITPNTIFKDIDRTLTYNQINDLRIFKYPNISYQKDPQDSTGTGLIATVLLSPKKKYSAGIDFDVIPIPSPIQQFGIGFNSRFQIRNIFRGAEIFEVSGGGSVGSSKDAGDNESSFFNISDVGANVKLTIPRFLFPFNTEKIIPKYMSPNTSISVGINAQNNIGLDRQNFNTIFNYSWKPSKFKTYQFDLVNLQFVRNLNAENYFDVYRNSFNQLNDIAQNIENQSPGTIDPSDYTLNDDNELFLTIPDGANNFIANINSFTNLQENIETVNVINERRERLTENNLIFASAFTWTRDTRANIFDNNFSRLRWRLETAGNLLSAISNIAGFDRNADGNFEALGVEYSQYVKGETEYIKHWEVGNDAIFAIRAFGGVAIPFGNSNSIPFIKSYFAGGANDNRGWRAYDLGPGSSGSIDEFNEANLKIALNAEYRYTILGAFKGAFFVDSGNIWNVLDNVEDEASSFTSISDISELAIASGLGLRYDFGFFVLRFDVGFKTYDPARKEGARWFKDYNFSNAVYNIGINYPF
jgi:hypothetical protein